MVFLVIGILMLIGIIILSIFGYPSLAPVVILLGSFVVGLAAKEGKGGAIGGFLTAMFALIAIWVLTFVFVLLGIFFLGFVWFPPEAESVGEAIIATIISMIYIVPLSPIVGAFGGLSGRLIFGQEPAPPTVQIPRPLKAKILSGFGGLRRIPPPVQNALICLSCGTPNMPTAQFCSKCGSHLRK